MKEYLSRHDAKALVAEHPGQFIGDASETPVTTIFEDAAVKTIAGKPIEFYPSKHPILQHLGGRALKILDVAPWYEPVGLYAASRGHNVTAIDVNAGAVLWQNEAAQRMGLDNYQAIEGDVHELASIREYDVIVAGMLLHFMNRSDAKKALEKIQNATKIGGKNAVSVYTNDNPSHEAQRGIVDFYESASALRQMYDAKEWHAIEVLEGTRAHAVDRGALIGKDKVLLPSIAEVIMEKRVPHYARVPDLSDIDDFNLYANS